MVTSLVDPGMLLAYEYVERALLSKRKPIPRITCNSRGCDAFTNGDKPYCYKHLLGNRHAQTVRRELERREAEAATVDAKGPSGVNIDGSRVLEILVSLTAHGVLSPERLRHLVFGDLEHLEREGEERVAKVVEGYLEALVDERFIKVVVAPSLRGGFLTWIMITPQGCLWAADKVEEP